MRINLIVVLFLTFICNIKAQINTRTTGDYKACLTWEDQSRVGFAPANIRGATTVTLTANANTYQSITFETGSSVLNLNGSNALNLNTSTGAINMDFCPTSFVVAAYTANANGCTPLWSGANLNWPWSDYAGYGPETQCIQLATISRPGYYRIANNTLTLIATFPAGPDFSSNRCGTNNFSVIAQVRKNNSGVSAVYTLMTTAGGNAGNFNFPDCVDYSTSRNLQFQRYSVTGEVDFGYCNVGDVLNICFTSSRPGSCTSSFGTMRGLAIYTVERY